MNVDTSKITNIAEREEAAKLLDAVNAAEQAYSDAQDKPETEVSDEELGRLDRAQKAAQKTYNDHPLDVDYNSYSDDQNVIRCALSNIPILSDDELLEDAHGRKVLSVLVLPPYEDSDDGDELPAPTAADGVA